jgi:hypothetical protein
MVWGRPLAMEQRRVASISGWVQRVVLMVWGERAIGAGVWASQGGSWTGDSLGNSFDMLYKLLEDIWVRG